jgi:hypothetical protein
MALSPEFEAFQSFRDLNLKSLLYYQAELSALRRDLHMAEWESWEDQRGNAFKLSTNLGYLSGSPKHDTRVQQQLDLIKRLREVLKEYSMYNQCSSSFSLR